MSIITFISEDIKETGQTISISAIATAMAIEHNYKILLFSTEFIDKTLENCFWDSSNRLTGLFARSNVMDVSNGLEGLIRTFASNRASGDIIRSYTKPVLKDRLDILQAPKTIDFKEYMNVSSYFSQIIDVANQSYDIVLVDLSKKIPKVNKDKVLNISDLVVVNFNQNITSINNFLKLKNTNEFYTKSNVLLALGRYNPNSKYSNKNVARYLKEKNIPLVVPYNILFADDCAEGKIIDYFLKVQRLQGYDNKDTYFIKQLRDTTQRLEYKMQEKINGLL